MTTTTLTSADIDALEPLLATALQPLPDALDRAMRALAMARSVADGAQVADHSSSATDAASEPAAPEPDDAGAPFEPEPPQYPGVAWCACMTPESAPRYAQREDGSWGRLWWVAGRWVIRDCRERKCRVCGMELQDGTVKEPDHAAE